MPPCEINGIGCPYGRIELWVGNNFAWHLYQLVSGQVIVAGMGDILGIKFEAINFIFDLYNIQDSYERQEIFEKIIAIDHVRMKIRSSEMQENIKREKSKAQQKR